MAEQGKYTGETIMGTIGESVGLGQVVYSTAFVGPQPADIIDRGVWCPVSSDVIYTYDSEGPKFEGINQLGIVLEAATYSPITLTQSGIKVKILLQGYYAPGLLGYDGYFDGYARIGAPMYLMPNYIDYGATDASGCLSGLRPASFGATQGVVRVVGYVWDLSYPYVIRFDPDNTWIEY